MLIKVLLKDCSSICHKAGTFKVVKGFSEVPQDVGTALLEFTAHYAQVLEPVDQEILDELYPSEDPPDTPPAGDPKGNGKDDKAPEK
jgi:hypothetical protein